MKFLLQYLLLILFLLLPFHALGVTIGNNMLYGSEFGAPFWMKAWKEILLLGIFAIGGIIWLQKILQKKITFDILDFSIVVFSVLALSISALKGVEISQLIYGIKYDLLPLWLFLLLRHIPLGKKYFSYLLKNIGYIGSIIVALGLVFLLLPPEIFTAIGYSADSSFHAINRPLASCQMVSFTDICRAQSTLSGPNQLAAYLLILIPLFAYLFEKKSANQQKIFWGITTILGGILLLFTFSRSAWIGLFIGLIFFFSIAKSFPFRKIILFTLAIIPLLGGIIMFSLYPSITEKIISRSASSTEHYEKSLEGIEHILQNPLGSGLGTAGAASKYTDIHQKGIIPENWYLQIGIETGIGGMILFICIVFLLLKKLSQKNKTPQIKEQKMIKNVVDFFAGKKEKTMCFSSIFLLSALLSLCVMSLMLHAWESAVVSYTFWGIAGIYMGNQNPTE